MSIDNSTDFFYEESEIIIFPSSDNDSVLTTLNSSTTTEAGFDLLQRENPLEFWIGVSLAIASSIFIGGSFIIKKKALIKLSKGGLRANQGGYGYLKDCMWWSGLLSMAIGEAANFIAYAFAPASLVSTLGVLSVLVTTILSSKFLKEKLNFIGKLGCLLCAIGSTIIVLHAPMDKQIATMEELEEKITNPLFIVYVNVAIVVSLILIYHFRPKLPETSTYTLLIWIGVCSLIGSLSVMAVKGFGLALISTIQGKNEFLNWLTWFCVVSLVISIGIQMNFLNKALDTFNTAVVTPIYYVMFTSCVIVASAILFREFASVSVEDWIGLSCGASTVLVAILLLHCCKDFDISLMTVAQQISLTGEDEEDPASLSDDDNDEGSPPKPSSWSQSRAHYSLLSPQSSKTSHFSYGTKNNISVPKYK